MNSNSGKMKALAMALDYAGLDYDEVTVERVNLSGDMLGITYDIEFTSKCLTYYVYIDVIEGEVVGFMTVPKELKALFTSSFTAA